jgi:hypothetical protein
MDFLKAMYSRKSVLFIEKKFHDFSSVKDLDSGLFAAKTFQVKCP